MPLPLRIANRLLDVPFASERAMVDALRRTPGIGTPDAALFRIAMKRTFSQLGALQLDKDVRRFVALLTSLLGRGAARDKCSRLLQLVELLNLDAPSDAKMIWRKGEQDFTAAEVRKVLGLRAEFSKREIEALPLKTIKARNNL